MPFVAMLFPWAVRFGNDFTPKSHPYHMHRLLLIAGMLLASTARACYPIAFSDLQNSQERVAIFWDAKQGVEHFVRAPSFSVKDQKMGFIVPLPSVPTLHEHSEAMFHRLDYEFLSVNLKLEVWEGGGLKEGASKDIVLESTTVAGYKASTLKADEPGALTAWLSERGWKPSRGGREWIERYIKKGYVFVAFEFTRDKKGAMISPKPVRLTFKTNAPFYPYEEPKDLPVMDYRNLAITFVSAEPMQPTFINKAKLRPTVQDAGLYVENGAEFLKKYEIPMAAQGQLYLHNVVDGSNTPREQTDLTWIPAQPERVGEVVLMTPEAVRIYEKRTRFDFGGTTERLSMLGAGAVVLYGVFRMLRAKDLLLKR